MCLKELHTFVTAEKMKSKFESESEPSEPEQADDASSPRSPLPDDDDTEYLPQTPPESPVELAPQLPAYYPAIQGCRNVEEFSCLNRIEEGTYGVVYRAKDKKTGECANTWVLLLACLSRNTLKTLAPKSV